jgi:hypothetical protein
VLSGGNRFAVVEMIGGGASYRAVPGRI